MIVLYYLAGRQIMRDDNDPLPAGVGDTLRLDALRSGPAYYKVVDRYMHKPMCPPDFVTLHLEMAEPERVWPVGHP